MRYFLFSMLAVFELTGCAHTNDRTAVELEAEAEAHRAVAYQARAEVAATAATRPVPSPSQSVSEPSTELDQYAAGRAAYEEEGARRNEAKATRIREGAELLCMRVPPAQRSSCPFPSRAKIEQMGRLIHIHPTKGTVEDEALRAQIDCAVAQARVDRPQGTETCPFFVAGATVNVVNRAEGLEIAISVLDTIAADEVVRRANLMLNK